LGPLPDFQAALPAGALTRQLADEKLWQLTLQISKSGAALESAIAGGEPAHTAKFAFQLAQSFSGFYHDFPVIHEQDPERRAFLLWMTAYFERQLSSTLGILGIPVPEYM
jgi:arginyl-tRNA synthetase